MLLTLGCGQDQSTSPCGAGRQTPRPEYAKGQNRLSWFSSLRNVVFASSEHKPGRDLLSHWGQEGR